MSTGLRRWLVPLVAALAVLAVVAVIWQQRPGASGEDVGFAGGGDAGQGSSPYAGSGPPDSPGALEPAPAPGDDPSDRGALPTVDEGSIAVTSFYRYDATHLALNYTNGVPQCYGKAGTPRVEESADAVVVTIPRIPARNAEDRVCIDIALMSSVDVTLESPLAGRRVLDGARDGAEVEEAAAPFSEEQAQ